MHHCLISDSPPRNLSYGVSPSSKRIYMPVVTALVRRALWQSCCLVQIDLSHSAFASPHRLFVSAKMPHFLFSVEFLRPFASGCRAQHLEVGLNCLACAEPLNSLNSRQEKLNHCPLLLIVQLLLLGLLTCPVSSASRSIPFGLRSSRCGPLERIEMWRRQRNSQR